MQYTLVDFFLSVVYLMRKKKSKNILLGGVEPPSRDSKSHMITATPQEIAEHLFIYLMANLFIINIDDIVALFLSKYFY